MLETKDEYEIEDMIIKFSLGKIKMEEIINKIEEVCEKAYDLGYKECVYKKEEQ